MKNQQPTIVLKNVRKRYSGESDGATWAVREVSAAIYPGELTVLMGPSGSGKTTLLSMIGGVLAPTSGEITVSGTRLDSSEEHQRQLLRRNRIGFVFQSYNLLSSLTALENIQVALSMRGLSTARASELLHAVGLAEKADAFPEQLSGGQRQRISVARALAGNPEVVLADEPTAALDATQGRQVMKILCGCARAGTTVIVVTHDPRVREFANRVIEMEDGRLKRIIRRVRPENVMNGRWTLTRAGTVVAEVSGA